MSVAGAQVGALSSTAGDNFHSGAINLAAKTAIGSTAGTLTLNGAIGGAGMLTKLGSGTLRINGANNYTNATLVSAGILIAGNATALGGTGSGTTVTSGATLALTGNIIIGAEALSLSGLGAGAVGALSNMAGANTYGGVITLAAATTIGSTAGTLTLSSNLVNGGFGLTLDGAGDITAGGAISGGGALTKTGTGTALLSVANSYTGTTAVSGGTLRLGVDSALPATAVTVASGATLDVNGMTQSLPSITSAGTLALGTNGSLTLTSGASSIGVITGSGTITVGPGASLTLTQALINSGVNIVLAGGTLNLGVLTHSIGTLSLTAPSTLDFASAGTAQLTVTTLTPAFALNVTNWTQGTDHFFAAAVTGAPVKDTANITPLTNITLTGRTASQTRWLSSNNEITALAPPTVAKAFSPSSIAAGGTSTLTITLSNSNATALTAAAFNDTYPAGLNNTATPSGATTCAGGSVTAGTNGSSVALSGGSIPAAIGGADGSCTVTVNVTSAAAGSYSNNLPVGAVTSSGGSNAALATATLMVTASVPAMRIIKTTTGGTGPNLFAFDLSGLSTSTDSISVTGASTASGSTAITGTAGQGASITETSPGGWPTNPVSASCVDLNSATPAATFGTLSGRQLSIAAGNMAVGADIRCTFVNSFGYNVSGRVFTDNGVGAGTANDGVINGAEAGTAGASVKLTDCAAITLATATTDSSGNYSLSVPFSTAANAPLCVEETNAASSVSTGASVGSTALPSGSAVPVGGTSYTYTRPGTPDRIAFAWNGTGHAGLNFGDVDPNAFAADGAKTGLAGNTVSYAHTFTAQTGGSVSFGIASAVATPAASGWGEKVFADAGCTGALQPGAALLFPPAAAVTVVAGQAVCVIVQEFIPATALEGYKNTVTVQASFTFTNAAPAMSATYTVVDTTTVSSSTLDLKKEVRNVTQGVTLFGISNQARSGDTLEYRITYTNNGASPISGLSVADVTPNYTTFVSAADDATPTTLTSCQKQTPANPAPTPTVLCATAQTMGGTGPVSLHFIGPVNPGATGTVLFQVKVD